MDTSNSTNVFSSENLTEEKDDLLQDVLAAATKDAGIDDFSSYFMSSSQTGTPATSNIEQEHDFQDWDFLEETIDNPSDSSMLDSVSGSNDQTQLAFFPNAKSISTLNIQNSSATNVSVTSANEILEEMNQSSFHRYSSTNQSETLTVFEDLLPQTVPLQKKFYAASTVSQELLSKKRKLSQEFSIPEKRLSTSSNCSPHCSLYQTESSSSLNAFSSESHPEEKRYCRNIVENFRNDAKLRKYKFRYLF